MDRTPKSAALLPQLSDYWVGGVPKMGFGSRGAWQQPHNTHPHVGPMGRSVSTRPVVMTGRSCTFLNTMDGQDKRSRRNIGRLQARRCQGEGTHTGDGLLSHGAAAQKFDVPQLQHELPEGDDIPRGLCCLTFSQDPYAGAMAFGDCARCWAPR